MAPTPTLRDIDSLPYHALQAEAAKHSIRRNLGAAKLREALKQLLGNNPNPNTLPPQWFIAANNPALAKTQETHAPCPVLPIKTNARIKSTASNLPRVPLMPHPPRMALARRTKHEPAPNPLPQSNSNSSIHVPLSINEPSSNQTQVQAKRDFASQPQLNDENHSTARHPPADTTSPTSHSPPSTHVTKQPSSIQNDTGRLPLQSKGEVSQNVNAPPWKSNRTHVAESERPPPCPSHQILPQAILDEAHRLGLTSCATERNIDFLTHLVRDTLEEVYRGSHVLCTLQASRQTITYISPQATPSSRTKMYRNDFPQASGRVPTLPSPVRVNSPLSEEPQLHQTQSCDSESCKASAATRHHPLYISTPANSAAFQPPRIPFPSLSKSLDPSSTSCDHLPLVTSIQGPSYPHFDQTSTSPITIPISPHQPVTSKPLSFQAPISVDPLEPTQTPSERPIEKSIPIVADMSSPQFPPPDDTFASSHRATPLRLESRQKRGHSKAQEDFANHQHGSDRPIKKTKVGHSTEKANDDTNLSHLEPHQNRITSPSTKKPHPTLPPIMIPNQPLKLFRSPPKGHLIVGRMAFEEPSPASSPLGLTSNPTLFGTEHYYGDSNTARFGEMFLSGPSKLLPSPLTTKNKSTNEK